MSAGFAGAGALVSSRAICVCPPLPPSVALATELGAGRRTRPTGTLQSSSAGLRVGSLLHLPEHVVEIEAGRLLALRILPEGGEEFPDVSLRRHHQEDVIDKPVIVGHRRDVGALERISAEIKHSWPPKVDKRP